MLPLRSVGRSNFIRVCVKFNNVDSKRHILMRSSVLYIYIYICQKCPEALYIGETGGNFRYRFNNHTHSIRQKKFLPLPLHFNADDHNINDLKVCILKGNFKDTKRRKLTELHLLLILKQISLVLTKIFLSSLNRILLSIKVKYFHPFLEVILCHTCNHRHLLLHFILHYNDLAMFFYILDELCQAALGFLTSHNNVAIDSLLKPNFNLIINNCFSYINAFTLVHLSVF